MKSQQSKHWSERRGSCGCPTAKRAGGLATSIRPRADHGTTTLFAALEVATGLVRTGHYTGPKLSGEFLDFMNRIVVHYVEKELHVILDNLNTHKPRHDRWLARHHHVHFHDTPTHASWLNQIECWFSILTRQALRGLSATSPKEVCLAIDDFTKSRNQHPVPFEWTKRVVSPGRLKHTYQELCN